MIIKDDDNTFSDDLKMKPGFHLGVTAEFPIDFSTISRLQVWRRIENQSHVRSQFKFNFYEKSIFDQNGMLPSYRFRRGCIAFKFM